MANSLFIICINYIMTHGRRIYTTSSDMSMATICGYSLFQHELPHRKGVLRGCLNFPHIYLLDQD